MTRDVAPMPWSEAVRSAGGGERDRFVESHLDLVRYLALRVATRLPSSVDVEDLVHDGVVGLLDAVDKYDPARGVRFRTYAESRVRGAILDGLRQKDWRPRSVRRGQRELDEAVGRLTAATGRAATEEEIANALGLGLDDYRSLLREVSFGSLVSLEEAAGADGVPAEDARVPSTAFERRERLKVVAEEITRIPPRERRVLELYYHEGMNMKEIGAIFGVTESRVCQLHSQAASRLRAAIRARFRAAAPAEETAS